MTSYLVDTRKLLDEVDRARGAGTKTEISYREVSRRIGVRSSGLFTRLAAGKAPEPLALVSLLMWVDPEARVADYAIPCLGHQDYPRNDGGMS